MSVITATILSRGRPVDPALELLSIDIRREIDRIPVAHLKFLDGDAAKREFPISNLSSFEPGAKIEIQLRYEGDAMPSTTVFKGFVVRHGVESDPDASVLNIEVKDAAFRLTQTRKSRIFRDKTDDQVFGEVIRTAGGLRLDTQTPPVKTSPVHREIVQYNCSDWDFLLSRADVNGLHVLARDGGVSLRKITMEGPARHHLDYGISEILNFEIEADAGVQCGNVQGLGWNLRGLRPLKSAKGKAFALKQGNLNGATLARNLGIGPALLTHNVPMERSELQAWADARVARSRMALLRGRLAVQGSTAFQLLDLLQIRGVGSRFNGKTVITGLRHRVDRDRWTTDIQVGLSSQEFSRQPAILDAPAAGLLPAVGGLHVGIVDQFKEDPDKLLRVRVVIPGIDPKAGTLWARVASPDAGNQRGIFYRPEVGDEVVVGFFNEDPRQPVILGSLFSPKNKPPEVFSKVSKENPRKGIVSRSGTKIQFLDDNKASLLIETPGKNQILLDDGKKSIQITDSHGNSILMDKNGIQLKSAKDLKLEAKGNVVVQGAKVDLK